MLFRRTYVLSFFFMLFPFKKKKVRALLSGKNIIVHMHNILSELNKNSFGAPGRAPNEAIHQGTKSKEGSQEKAQEPLRAVAKKRDAT